MDSIFFLEEGDRAVFLLKIMESLGCTYICLWQYIQPSNCFMSLGGIYNGDNDVGQRLFQEYRHSWLIMHNSRIPGLAFKNNVPYMELQFADFQSHASNPVQLQFYQEAGIKTVICMGCSIGEIEVGMTSSSQGNLEMGMTNLFAEYFSRQAIPTAPAPATTRGIPNQLPPIDQNRPSSSSSFSIDSPGEYSSLLFNVASTPPYVPEPPRTDTFSDQTIRPIPPVSATAMPYQQAIQTLNQIQGIQLPILETEDAALTRAYLAVMASPSSSSSSSRQSRENLPTDYNQIATQKATAFRRFRSGLGPNLAIATATTRRQNMFRRSINFFRNLNMMRSRQEQMQPNPRAPTSTQVHHMISERRRREKLNDSFQLLRSLLPPGTKKDKASVLASTTEYLSSLKAQVEELSKKNEMLEAQLLQSQNKSSFEPINQAAGEAIISSSTGGNERLDVEIRNVGESTSESRTVDLQISVRRECSILDLVTRLLEFLKSDNNVNLESVAANTRSVVQSEPVTHIILRLRIEGREWDESSFQEAVKRVVDDLA